MRTEPQNPCATTGFTLGGRFPLNANPPLLGAIERNPANDIEAAERIDLGDVRAVLAYAKTARLARCREYLTTVTRALRDSDPGLSTDWFQHSDKLDDMLVDAGAVVPA